MVLVDGLLQRGLAERALATDLSVHRQRAPATHRRGLSSLAGLQQGDRALRGQALVVVVVQLQKDE